MPNIKKIGQCFTELLKVNTGTVFLRHGVSSGCQLSHVGLCTAIVCILLSCQIVSTEIYQKYHFV